MNTQLIEESWNSVAPYHHAIAETFYERLFQQYPDYARLFSADSMPEQMERMVRTLALVSSNADSPSSIRPHLHRLGQAHSEYGLGPEDFEAFSGVMIAVLGEYCRSANGDWSEACEQAWRDAFSSIIEPMMLDGMQH
ncbi:MAG: globin domain-containing protein [Pseudomonadota bacterium]